VRYLIVNADDFGLSAETNRGIIEAHERGILTSASLMVRQPAATEAAAYGREHPQLSVGLHVDLGEWRYRDGVWEQADRVVPEDDALAIETEVMRQLEAFRLLMGTDPTHLDSHQHVHRHEPAHAVVARWARELNLPLRHYSPAVAFCGDFYGQGKAGMPFPEGISVENFFDILARLPAGVAELGCHPGLDATLDSSYREERATEVATLCDPRVRAALTSQEIELISFRDLAGGPPAN
jgi:predicted glycoside hydrolase/deacetylase ChbG (UPF0249 family)